MAALRVLITRLSAVGDCVHTFPVACAVRRAHPDARIVWLVQPAAAGLVAGHPCVDEVFVVAKNWLKSPRAVWSLRRQLRGQRFDWSIDPQSLTKSAVAAWLSGAARRVGFRSPQGRELAPWLNNVRVTPSSSHVVDRYLELLQPLGICGGEVEFRLEVPAAIQSAMDVMLQRAGLASGFWAINPGAGWDSRLWPVERYAALARAVGGATGVPAVVVWAGQRESEWADQIVAGSQGHATRAPSTSLLELAALLRRARCLVASDTGPLHIAAALGTVCVGLYGTTDPQKSGPYGAHHVTIQAYYQAGTSRQRRSATNDAMREIDVDRVVAATCRVLGIRLSVGGQSIQAA